MRTYWAARTEHLSVHYPPADQADQRVTVLAALLLASPDGQSDLRLDIRLRTGTPPSNDLAASSNLAGWLLDRVRSATSPPT